MYNPRAALMAALLFSGINPWRIINALYSGTFDALSVL
jgi:hypothetical protein